jgi:hypothetical protein
MPKTLTIKVALAFAAPAVAVLAVASSAAAAAPNAAQNLSFSASSDGASAHWSAGKGSPIDLTLGTTLGSYAVITLHHLAATPVGGLSEPTFSTDHYNSGSPRYYITLSNGDTLWGYPPNAGLNGSDFAWAINNGNAYQTWNEIQAAEGSATVTGAYVIADADQAPGTVDVITGLSFGADTYN